MNARAIWISTAESISSPDWNAGFPDRGTDDGQPRTSPASSGWAGPDTFWVTLFYLPKEEERNGGKSWEKRKDITTRRVVFLDNPPKVAERRETINPVLSLLVATAAVVVFVSVGSKPNSTNFFQFFGQLLQWRKEVGRTICRTVPPRSFPYR